MTKDDLNNHETLMQFPCEFSLKVIGLAGAQFENAAIEILHRYVPNLSKEAFQIRPSANGKYAAMTFIFIAESRTQLDNLYQALSASSYILMAL